MQHIWSDGKKEYLKEITPGHHHKEIQELMNEKFSTNFTVDQIKGAIARYKLNTGFTGGFQKGHEPYNKGVKGYCAPGSEKGWFKEGNKPYGWVPIGSERITKDGYIQVKIQDGKDKYNWKGKHILIWEMHHGELPGGHAVIFADGDTRNFNINNLVLVSRHELLIMNKQGLIKKEAEITKTGVMIAKLQSKIYQRKAEEAATSNGQRENKK